MKKPKKIHHQKIYISEDYVVKLQEQRSSFIMIDLLLECLKESDSLKQTAILKKIGSSLNDVALKDVDQLANLCIEVLAEIFVVLDFKNPARRTMASLFDSLPESLHSPAYESLTSSVLKDLKEQETKITTAELRPAIDMVASLMENFKLGNDVIKFNGIQVLGFLSICLQHLVAQARIITNPLDQTTRMMDCLSTIKTVVAILQKNSKQITEDSLSLGSSLQLWIFQMEAIMQQLFQVLNHDFLPDCQTASGMAICLIVYLFSRPETVGQVVLETVFSHHVEGMNLYVKGKVAPDWIAKAFENRQWKVPMSFKQLCLCHGVLTMIPVEDLVTPLPHKGAKDITDVDLQEGQTLLFDILFPNLCHLCESLKESFSCLSAFKVLTLWAEQARSAAKLNPKSIFLKTLLSGSAVIPQKLLSFVWDYWDHPVEVVRYQTKAIFEHVVKTHIILSGQEPSRDDFLKNLTGNLIEVGWHNRGIYGPLCCLTSVVGAKSMLGWYPCIPVQVMMVLKDRITAPHVIDFLDVITQFHKQEIVLFGSDMNEWLTTWIVPLVDILRSEGSSEGLLIEHSLSKLLKCYPESLQFIVNNLQGEQDKHVEILMTCLKTARSLGITKVNNDTTTDITTDTTEQAEEVWGGVVPVDWLKKALCYIENQTRLDALGLLCDSPRTTEPISVTDLALLKVFLPLNMNNQSPSFRQRCSTHLKKLLMRMKESLRISVKRLERTNHSQTDSKRCESYQEFLHWFCDVLFASLFPGASFARRITALHHLQLLSSIFINDRKEGTSGSFVFDDVMTEDNITALVDCLSDTYEVNKHLAYQLLTSSSSNSLPFQIPATLKQWSERIGHLVSSPRAVDASTASILLKLLIDKCLLPLYPECSSSNPLIMDNTSTNNTRHSVDVYSQAFRVIYYLLSSLKTQSSVAEQSLTQASSQAPMHGLVYCLREVLGHLNLSRVSGDKSWQQLVSTLLDECLHVADLVSPVVTCSSPEGHLIDEEFDDDIDFSTVQDDTPTSDVFNASSQVLLVCCWRTMKEVALILGELVQNAPIRIKQSGLLTPPQVHRIGDFFTTVLLTSKHRGAFELAYTGFVKLCSTLWTCEDATLRQLPQQWLFSLISDITACVPSEVLCGTRRSAGVPFFVQAIVTTEPLAAGKACFKRLMTDLIPIADQPINKDIPKDSTLPQVHARNILRAIFRDTRLGEDVFPFVGRGLMIAVSGFLSGSWAIRNSSTLLFSALMTRIFGVKKSKDEHAKRNCMTGREFFTRFPEMHSFLLEELRKATEAIEKSLALDLHPSLYPVLVLLSRLYPSAMDGVDSTLNMTPFIPYVIKCGGSSVLKTRAMAARAIVPLVTGESLVQVLKDLLESLPVSSSSVDQNKLHGTLLQIQHLVKEHLIQSTSSENIKSLLTSKVLPLFDNFKWIVSRSNPCAITRAVYLDITFNLFICLDWQKPGQHCTAVKRQTLEKRLVHMRTYITHTALVEITTMTPRPFAVISIGETLVKEVCTRICLKALSECGDTDQEHVNEIVQSVSSPSPAKVTHEHCLVLPTNHHSVVKSLLASQDYEVRLVTLQHLQTYLSRSHCSSRGYSISRSVDMASDHGNLEAVSALTGAIEKVVLTDSHLEDIAINVLEMAMGREQHLDCLGQVFEVLSLVAEYLSFPYSFSSGKTVSLVECWQHVLLQAHKSGQRDSVRCALLHFLARMTDKVYQQLVLIREEAVKIKTRTAVLSLNDLLKSTSDENQSFNVRYKTAEILSNGALNCLLWDRSKQLGCSSLDLWSVVIGLLHDDDSSVRDCMANVSTVLPSNRPALNNKQVIACPSLPTLAIEIVLDRVLNEFYVREPRGTLQWILEWITTGRNMWNADIPIGACSETTSDQNNKIDLLFEKNSLNSYQEKEMIAQAALKALKNLNTQTLDSMAGSDVINDVFKRSLEELQTIIQETKIDFSNLFLRFYFNVIGLAATGILKKALLQGNSRDNNSSSEFSETENPNSCNPCLSPFHIPFLEQLNKNVNAFITELCSKFPTNKMLFNVISHRLIRNALRELCIIYDIDMQVIY